MAAWLLTSISNGNQLPAPCDFPPRPETPPTTLAAVPGDKPAPFRRQMSRPYLSLAPQRYLVRLRAARYRVALAGDGALFRSRRASPASSRSPVPLPGSIRVSGRIWCTRVHQTLPEARIHPANVVAVAWGTQGLSGRRAGVIRAERSAAPDPDGTARRSGLMGIMGLTGQQTLTGTALWSKEPAQRRTYWLDQPNARGLAWIAAGQRPPATP
jgi:hypothetical protein